MICRVVFITFILIASGCATLYDYENVDYAKISDECDTKPSVSYNLIQYWDDYPGGGESMSSYESVETYKDSQQKLFQAILLESGMFKSVQAHDLEADIQIDVKWHQLGDIKATDRYKFSAATLFLLPMVETIGMKVSGTISKEGKRVEFDYYDEGTRIYWLPMILMAPFYNGEDMLADVSRSRFKMITNKVFSEEQWFCKNSSTKP